MSDVAIVVGTLDLYKTVWPGFIHGLRKYWPDCQWPAIFITNHLNVPGYKTIKVGGDHTNWGGRMLRGLKKIGAEIVLWTICDHWITAPPDVPALMDFVELIGRGGADRIRLYPGLDHDFGKPFSADNRLIVLDRKSPYRTSCKPSLWRRKTFLQLLRDGESPWDFERNGRRRSAARTFMVTKGWHWFFVTKGAPHGPWDKSPVVKGRWTTAAKKYCENEGLSIGLEKHPVWKDPFGKDRPDYILP